MKRLIKRTEITIETVEITTMRTTGQAKTGTRDVTITLLPLSGTAEAVETDNEEEIDEQGENGKPR
jgi:hypothetical protein